MNRIFLIYALSLSFLILLSSISIAQVELGKKEYEENCAVCHGHSGKGDGPFATNLDLKNTIPSLTLLQKNNGGIFPVNLVYKMIDGRAEVRMHGPRDMPIWGEQYKTEAFERYGFKEHVAAGVIRKRILSLIEYLKNIQE